MKKLFIPILIHGAAFVCLLPICFAQLPPGSDFLRSWQRQATNAQSARSVLGVSETMATATDYSFTTNGGRLGASADFVVNRIFGEGNATGDFLGNGAGLSNLNIAISMPLASAEWYDTAATAITNVIRDSAWQYYTGLKALSNQHIKAYWKVPSNWQIIVSRLTVRCAPPATNSPFAFGLFQHTITNQAAAFDTGANFTATTNVGAGMIYLWTTNTFSDTIWPKEIALQIYKDTGYAELTNGLWLYDWTIYPR